MGKRPSDTATVRHLRRLIREELAAPAAGGLGKVIDDLTSIFLSKMKAQFPSPQAESVIKQQADQLRSQVTAQIKAAAAQVKTSLQ